MSRTKSANTHGTFENLAQSPMATWEGWVIYSWDMGCRIGLFDQEPAWIPETESWSWDDAIEDVDPYFLKACGITVSFEIRSRSHGKSFYYGHGCAHGDHPPIKIKLTLPVPLLEAMGLTATPIIEEPT